MLVFGSIGFEALPDGTIKLTVNKETQHLFEKDIKELKYWLDYHFPNDKVSDDYLYRWQAANRLQRNYIQPPYPGALGAAINVQPNYNPAPGAQANNWGQEVAYQGEMAGNVFVGQNALVDVAEAPQPYLGEPVRAG